MTTPHLPLVRRVSAPVSRLLMGTPATPNQITVTSIGLGLLAAAMLAIGTHGADVAAAALLTASYILDNCDGEIARAKRLTSPVGALLDTVGDGVVHAAFFAALGYGAFVRSGESLWLELGLAATVGTIINSALALPDEMRRLNHSAAAQPASAATPFVLPSKNESVGHWMVFVLRELARADFCFIALILAGVDWLMYLLPFAAVGAQVYWIMFFVARGRKFHV